MRSGHFYPLPLLALLTALSGWIAAGCGNGGDTYDPGETTATACQDEQDNDGDGDIDCDDSDCNGFVFCLPATEVTAAACSNEQDDDGDGQTDCDDTDCQGFVFCQVENTEDMCPNGLDDDSDGLTDCFDPDCQVFDICAGDTEDTVDRCQNGLDDDEDLDTDCADPDCQVFDVCQVENTEALCQNGLDDDDDGDTDCDDPDCQVFDVCPQDELEESPSACKDGVDNDGDGLPDCLDPDCRDTYVFCMPASETTAARCRDGQDNDGDLQTDCADPDCQGFVFCPADSGETTEAACSDGVDNDGDTMVDCDDPGCWTWGFCLVYHGFALVDHWRETFDGIERPALPWADAAVVCEDLGGRLPTVTELWRNNATSGTGDLSDDLAANQLWTRIASASPGQRVTVRLSDGSISYLAEISTAKFRCVWPDSPGAGFDPARCHGDPESPCWGFDRVLNVDSQDRPAVDFVAAVNECAFYGASIPVVGEWGRMIHAGIPGGTNRMLWDANAMYWFSGNYGMAYIGWTDEDRPHWHFSSTDGWGGVSQGTTDRNFRCAGLATPAAYPAPAATCFENCVTFDQRRSQIKADDTDRPALGMYQAVADCRTSGGELPNLAEATELLHAGWANGTNTWQWLTDTVYWWVDDPLDPFFGGNYGHALFSWLDEGPSWWYYTTGAGAMGFANVATAYRCIWRSSGPTLPACQPGQVVTWSGAVFACAPRVNGNSAGQAYTIDAPDSFGNVWDSLQRTDQVTWADARTTCEDLGGRLPTASEIFGARADGNPHWPIGDTNAISPLWTTTTTSVAGNRILVRVSDGAATQAAESSLQFFRCIWPSTRGDVLAASNCYGPPDDECFTTGSGLVADKYDRLAVDMAAAIEECGAVGGHLPDQRELAELIHAGLPNGSDTWIWMAEPMYWYDIGYGYATAKWLDAGLDTWEFANPGSGSLNWPYDFSSFRCVYSTRLR